MEEAGPVATSLFAVVTNCFASNSYHFYKASCLASFAHFIMNYNQLVLLNYSFLWATRSGHSEYIPPYMNSFLKWSRKRPCQYGPMRWRHMHTEKVVSNYLEVLIAETRLLSAYTSNSIQMCKGNYSGVHIWFCPLESFLEI